jgi:hypothetical protein
MILSSELLNEARFRLQDNSTAFVMYVGGL